MTAASTGQAQDLDLLVLGVGAGVTAVYNQECSSSFLLQSGGQPVLLLDAGLGVVAACRAAGAQVPEHLYISHNHTDHSGELPVLLAVEKSAGRRLHVYAEEQVLATLQCHRLHELLSTGLPLDRFAAYHGLKEGQLTPLPVAGLALQPALSRHKERCFGLLIYQGEKPILGWTADSGADTELYSLLSRAPVVLVDARAHPSTEHASCQEVQEAASSGPLKGCRVLVYGYGAVADAPTDGLYSHLEVLRPGRTVLLSDTLAMARAATSVAAAAGR